MDGGVGGRLRLVTENGMQGRHIGFADRRQLTVGPLPQVEVVLLLIPVPGSFAGPGLLNVGGEQLTEGHFAFGGPLVLQRIFTAVNLTVDLAGLDAGLPDRPCRILAYAYPLRPAENSPVDVERFAARTGHAKGQSGDLRVVDVDPFAAVGADCLIANCVSESNFLYHTLSFRATLVLRFWSNEVDFSI